MFVDDANKAELENFINEWQVDGLGTREAFVGLARLLAENSHSLLSFHPRPGITCSLRGHIAGAPGQEGPLYAMIDVIDDDPRQRWLSVCFYGERITDPEERGDMVPGGLLGQDAVVSTMMATMARCGPISKAAWPSPTRPAWSWPAANHKKNPWGLWAAGVLRKRGRWGSIAGRVR
jgi:hypothetical protein